MTIYESNDIQNYPKFKQLDKFIPANGYVAGGTFKNLLEDKKNRDIDIYFHTEEDFNNAYALAESAVSDTFWTKLYENPRVVAYKIEGTQVEYIRYKFGNPSEIMEDFDFTITKMAYGNIDRTAPSSPNSWDHLLDEANKDEDVKPYKILHHIKFFEHLHQRRLVIEGNIPMPISTFERTYKYTRYGFNLCRDSKLKLLTAIAQRGTIEESELSRSLYAGLD